MNKRIQELAEQAGSTHKLNLGVYQFYTDELEKFAELIVKECTAICDETRTEYSKHRKAAYDFTDKNIYAEGEAVSDLIKYKMKRHLGVKE